MTDGDGGGNGTKGPLTVADKFGIAWLVGSGVFLGLVMLFVLSPPPGFEPAVPAGRLYNEILLPAFWLVTILSAMEVFGKSKVQGLINRLGGKGGNQ